MDETRIGWRGIQRSGGVRKLASIMAAAWLTAGPWAFAQESSDEGLDLLVGTPPAKDEKPVANEEKPAPKQEAPATKGETPGAGEGGPVVKDEKLPPEVKTPAAEEEKPAVGKRRPAQAVEEIVVTARKTEENIQDVPVAVTALSSEALEQTSTFEMKDLGYRAPNMTIRYGPGQPTALIFQIRGQIERDVLGTLDPPVAFYDDGVYVARPHGSNASFIDVKNIQVLRGPQGTLFGRNTTGGAVLLSTNDPNFESVSGAVGATLGSFGRRTFNGVLNVPLVHDWLAFRFAGQTVSSDGYAFDETNGRDIATENNSMLRAKLLYQPLENLSVLLNGQYIDVNQLGTPIKPLFVLKPTQARQASACCLAYLNATAQNVDYDSFVGGDPDRVNYDPGLKPISRLKVGSFTLTTIWDQPWATIKFIGGIRENADVANHIDIDGSPSTIVDTLQANENLQQSYELQFTGSWFDSRLTWAAGAVFFNESGKERGTTAALTPIAAAINPIVTPGDIDNKSAGVYAQSTYALTSKLKLTGGLRYSWDNKRLVLRSTMGPTCAIPSDKQDPGTTCQGTFDDSFDNISYTVGTDYRLFENALIFDDVLIYTSVTTGYRAGGQNLRGTSDETLTPFKPETLMQFETGLKSEFLDRRVRLNGAGFYTFFNDIQRTILVASQSVLPATVVNNAASAEIVGAELELTALPPVTGLDLGASLGITLPKYNKFTDTGGDRSNEKFDDVPKMTYSLSGGYMREIFGTPWLNHLDWSWKAENPHSQGELRYFRSQGVDIESLFTEPPIGILNARSALTFGNGLECGVFGKDLTDERPSAALAIGGGPDFVSKLIYNAGRELGFDVTYRF